MVDIVSNFDINFDARDCTYQEGDTVTGEVVVELKDDIVIEVLVVTFSGKASVQLVARGRCLRRRSRPATAAVERYLNQNVCLYSRVDGCSRDMLVPRGRHAYPFRIQLPYNLPSTFSATHGHIAYQAKATLERPWQPRVVTKRPFTIANVVSLSSLSSVQRPLHCNKSRQIGVWCLGAGTISAIWRLDRMGYAPGETIRINGEINNSSGQRIKRSQAVLTQHVKYCSNGGDSLHEKKQVARVSKGVIRPGEIDFWRKGMCVPPLPPSGLAGCRLINVWYTLTLSVVPCGVYEALETTTDIIIATIEENAFRHPFIAAGTLTSNPSVYADYFS